MKAWKEPKNESWGINYRAGLTKEFKKLIDLAKEKMKPFSDKETSRFAYYFKVKGEAVSCEFDCCDDEGCIKQAKKAIRLQYGKGTHIEECYCDNDGDHENIEICSICGRPLNNWLTWCNYELEYLEQKKPWNAQFLKDEGFVIGVILNSTPTMDCDISGYAKHQRGDILQDELQLREDFFQRIGQLAQSVIDTDFTMECSNMKNKAKLFNGKSVKEGDKVYFINSDGIRCEGLIEKRKFDVKLETAHHGTPRSKETYKETTLKKVVCTFGIADFL